MSLKTPPLLSNTDIITKASRWMIIPKVQCESVSLMKTAGASAVHSWAGPSPQAFCLGSYQRSSLHLAGSSASSLWQPAALPEWCSCRSPPLPPPDCLREPPRPPGCSRWCGRSSPGGGSAAFCSSAAWRSHPGPWCVHTQQGLATAGWDTCGTHSGE